MAIRTVIVAAILLLLAVLTASAAGPDTRWVVLAARQDQGDAVDLARTYARSIDGVRVARAKNGWFAVIVGPVFVKTIAEARANLAVRLYLPGDAYLGRLEGFSEVVFDAPPSRIKAIAEYHGDSPAVVRFQSVTVALGSAHTDDGSRVPTAEIRAEGIAPFRTMIAKQGLEGAESAKAKIIQLDPSTSAPQVVLTYYTGGAHCCTFTKIATLSNSGSWSIVEAPQLDSEGYEFEDVDGDGFVELINVDNSFLYTFDSYAGSFAPPKVTRFSGGTLTDVTTTPGIRLYLQRELRWMEGFAKKDNSLWTSNGFLAGWVASKAQLGEVDAAWQRMLASYDHNPMFGPEACSITLPIEKCPVDKLRRLSFPEALRAHFVAHGYPAPVEPAVAVPPRVVETIPPAQVLSGTAFFITHEGHLLTNAHVVKECRLITISHAAEEEVSAKVVAIDVTNDLAIISTPLKPEAVAAFRSGVRLGEAIAAYGFPLSGLLSSGGNFTLGNVTALAGLRDDSRMLQISAPVQAGNSGGPLLDETGAVVGIVVSKLNAIMVAIVTDDLAQNINFAIKASAAMAFAEAQGINIDAAEPNRAILRPADVADKARAISAHLTCTR